MELKIYNQGRDKTPLKLIKFKFPLKLNCEKVLKCDKMPKNLVTYQ